MVSHEKVEPDRREGLAAPGFSGTEEDLDWLENQGRALQEQRRTDRVFWGLCSIGTMICAALLLTAIGFRTRGGSNSGAWKTASAERDKMTPTNPSVVAEVHKPMQSSVPPNSGSEASPELRRIATATDR